MKKSYKIEVDCANCADKMENAARAVQGVKDVCVNFMTLKMQVEFKDGYDIKETMKAVRDSCKRVDDDCEVFI